MSKHCRTIASAYARRDSSDIAVFIEDPCSLAVAYRLFSIKSVVIGTVAADDCLVKDWWKKRKGKVMGGLLVATIVGMIVAPYIAWHVKEGH
jgi:hypothetical protein